MVSYEFGCKLLRLVIWVRKVPIEGINDLEAVNLHVNVDSLDMLEAANCGFMSHFSKSAPYRIILILA